MDFRFNGKISGVVPPVLTPLDADGNVDHESLTRLVNYLIDAGAHGLFALGSSSETAFFTDTRRLEALRTIIDVNAGRVPILVGAIDTQTERVLEKVEVLAKLDIAGIVATAPFYAITGPEEIHQHFTMIGKAARSHGLQLFAYDIPVCVHTKLSPDLLVSLAQEGVLQGVKDSSGDDVSFRRLCAKNHAVGAPLSVLTGHEVVVDGAYLAGADGAVPGLGNVDPAGYVKMHNAALEKDWERVRKEQDRLAALFEIVFAPADKVGPAAGVGAFKTALQQCGIFTTNVMTAPMTPIVGDTVTHIRDIVAAAGLPLQEAEQQ